MFIFGTAAMYPTNRLALLATAVLGVLALTLCAEANFETTSPWMNVAVSYMKPYPFSYFLFYFLLKKTKRVHLSKYCCA